MEKINSVQEVFQIQTTTFWSDLIYVPNPEKDSKNT